MDKEIFSVPEIEMLHNITLIASALLAATLLHLLWRDHMQQQHLEAHPTYIQSVATETPWCLEE